jgi:hypothetical protein
MDDHDPVLATAVARMRGRLHAFRIDTRVDLASRVRASRQRRRLKGLDQDGSAPFRLLLTSRMERIGVRDTWWRSRKPD